MFSAAATAFAATSISFDVDISPIKRKRTPAFYGYVPNVGRGKVFVLMLLSNTCHVINNFFSSALFLVASPLWFLIYSTGDMGLYFAIKIARRDFFTYFPIRGITMQCAYACLYRIVQKVMSDYTGIVQMRSPKVRGFAVDGKADEICFLIFLFSLP